MFIAGAGNLFTFSSLLLSLAAWLAGIVALTFSSLLLSHGSKWGIGLSNTFDTFSSLLLSLEEEIPKMTLSFF